MLARPSSNLAPWLLLLGCLAIPTLSRADVGMQVSKLPLWKAIDQPVFSLDGSHVELLSLLFLFMATALVMMVRRRRQLVRHLVQLASLLIFFYVVLSCLGVFGMIRNTIHGVTLIGTVYTEAFFWMSLPVCVLSFSLVSGPFFCGWICPTGTIQEWVAMAREALTKKQQLSPGPTSLTLIGLFFTGFLYLVFTLSAERKLFVEDSSLYWAASILLLDFLVLSGLADDLATRSLRWVSFGAILVSALFHITITSPVHFAFVDVLDPASAITTLILAVASIFVARAWCRYICPFGLVMSLVSRYSRIEVRAVGPCSGCGRCVLACRVAAVTPGQVRADLCQACFACVDACPSGAIQIVDRWLPSPHQAATSGPSAQGSSP